MSNGDVFSGGNSGPGGEVLRRERREAWAEGEAAESLSEPGDDRSRPTAYTALSLDSERGSPGVSVAEGNATTVVATPTSPDDRRAANEAVDAPGSALSGPHVSGDQTDPAPASPTGAAPQDDARDQRSAARERDPAPGWPSSQGPPGGPGQIPGPTPSVAPSLGGPPFPLAEWGPDGATAPIVPDLLLAEVGPDVMPKPEGPESLWSEAASDREGMVENITFGGPVKNTH